VQGSSEVTGGGGFLTGHNGAMATTTKEATRCLLARPRSFTELFYSSK
jgi:hypothetical protein